MRRRTFYITTPIYYVNDQPHIGHCYTTLLADAAARFWRLAGRDVFFLTGADEHAEKVVAAARERGLSPQAWADQNAQAFQRAFAELGSSHDDFLRTSQARHKERVGRYIQELLDKGEIELGQYVGWWDASQEEYVTDTVAREHDFKSPVTGKPLVRRSEENYFFRLSKHAEKLAAHIEAHPDFIAPQARRNEVLGRIRQGLLDVPVSRKVQEGDDWGVRMPGDASHRVYVWIDALFNYLTAVDTEERSVYWPPSVNLVGKDILWFHAVIWPALLMALDRPLPEKVYAHSYWIREGRKMSKSLGNFLDMPTLRGYVARYGLDAVRWFLLTQGPLGAADADFAHAKFVEVYNADLANGVGNTFSRTANMLIRYFDGAIPASACAEPVMGFDLPTEAAQAVGRAVEAMERFEIDRALGEGLALARRVDAFIHATEPFKLAKEPARRDDVAAILTHAAEALRIASLLLQPAMPCAMAELQRRLGLEQAPGAASLEARAAWGGLEAGARVEKGEPLFPRADVDEPAPGPVEEAQL